MAETATDEKFRADCIEQIKRLGVFDAFRCMDATARKEYRKFFESKTRDIAKVERVIDESVTLDSIPKIAELYAIWDGLFPQLAPEVAEDERTATARWMREWREQEMANAHRLRQEFIARGNFKRQQQPITDADIQAIRSRQLENQKRMIEGAETLESAMQAAKRGSGAVDNGTEVGTVRKDTADAS